MTMADFLAQFRVLHDKARRGDLDTSEQGDYDRSRDTLANALIEAQKQTLRPGERPREALRVAKAIQVELQMPAERIKSLTLDVSAQGFSVLLGNDIPGKDSIRFHLKVGGEALTGEARAVESIRQKSNVRVGFAIERMDGGDREKLMRAVFDELLARFGSR